MEAIPSRLEAIGWRPSLLGTRSHERSEVSHDPKAKSLAVLGPQALRL